MFYSLTGKLIHMEPGFVALECGGVAFKCLVTANTMSKMPPLSETVTLLTHLNVREDALELFGFYDRAELDAFKLITTVNGVGAKLGLSILSDFAPEKLALCVAAGDSKTLQRANGVGAKLAQRIILELKDKLGVQTEGGTEIRAAGADFSASNAAMAIEALVVLGYSKSDAALTVSRLDPALPVEQMIKEALRAFQHE